MTEYDFIHNVLSKNDTSPLEKEMDNGEINLNQKFKSGSSMLHVAVSDLKKDIVECLLKNGADPNVLNSNGLHPLHLAVMEAKGKEGSDILDLLLSEKSIVIDPQEKTNGYTPLFYAVRLCKFDCVKKLIQKNANPYLRFYNNKNVISFAQGSDSCMAIINNSPL